MPLSVVVAGIEKTVSSASLIVAGVAKTVRRVEAWNGSAWKVVKNFAPAFSASVSVPEVYGVSTAPGGGFVTTNSVTVTPSGGLAPYTYAWSLVSGASATAQSPTFATTTFRANVGPSDSVVSTFACLVTDSLGQNSAPTVFATFSNFSTS